MHCGTCYFWSVTIFLAQTGNSDGQTLIVREGDNGVAYSWNSKELNWDKVSTFVH
jgi:hypothetical protein